MSPRIASLIGPGLLVLAGSSVAFGVAMVLLQDTIGTSGRPDLGETFHAGQVFASIDPTITHVFHVKNRSYRVLKVLEKKCSCSCTATDLSAQAIQPGDHATLTMSVRLPHNHVENSNTRCELVFDDGTSRTYTIAYETFPRVLVTPETLDFGAVHLDKKGAARPDNERTTVVTLFAPADEELPRLNLPRETHEIAVRQVGEPQEYARGSVKVRQYELAFKQRRERLSRGDVRSPTCAQRIDITTDSDVSSFVTLTWHYVDRYRVEPSPVFFGRMDAGGPAKKASVLLIGPAGESLNIKSIESDSALLVPIVAPTRDGDAKPRLRTADLVLDVPASVPDGAVSGTVHVTMEDDEASVISIPWSAFVRRLAYDLGPPSIGP